MVDLTKTVHIVPKRTSGATEILDLSAARGEPETKLLDFGDAATLQARLRELCAAPLQSSETAPDLTRTAIVTPPPNLAPSAGTNLAQTCVIAPARAELDRTMYDGGALRDYARTLAESPSEEPAAALQPLAVAPSRSLERRTRGWAAGNARWRAACLNWHTARRRWWAARTSRKLLLALLPLAFAASAAGTIATLARRRSPPIVESVPAALVLRRPTLIAPARIETSSAAPARARAPLPTLAASELPRVAPTAPLAADPALERAALRAAFDGNQREAIAAYERLAERPGGEPFKLAARLLREDRVRKP